MTGGNCCDRNMMSRSASAFAAEVGFSCADRHCAWTYAHTVSMSLDALLAASIFVIFMALAIFAPQAVALICLAVLVLVQFHTKKRRRIS